MYVFQQKDFARYIYCSLREFYCCFMSGSFGRLFYCSYELFLIANDLAYLLNGPFNEKKIFTTVGTKDRIISFSAFIK